MRQVLWSERAFARRQAIEDYILYSFGYAAYADYVEAVNEWKNVIRENPCVGAVEPLLVGGRKEYRSVVIANQTKCIYYVEDDCIMIADWWDTRRSIVQLKQNL